MISRDGRKEKDSVNRNKDGKFIHFQIFGYLWVLRDYGISRSSTRRRFISNIVKVVFVDQKLIDPEQATTPITDVYPIAKGDNSPLGIKFGDLAVARQIEERLNKMGDTPPAIDILIIEEGMQRPSQCDMATC